MADKDKRVIVSVEALAVSNSVTLGALVELLEEKGVLTREQILQRVRTIRDKQDASEKKM